jgi:3-oxoadipate CoA-transferase alpha subunit
MAKRKVCADFDQAVTGIFDGAVIMIGTFGGIAPTPQNLILALARKGVRNLTIVCNNAGDGCLGLGNIGGKPFIDHWILVNNGQVRKFIGSIPASLIASRTIPFEELYREGKVELELVPQGTLAERIRAGGAGIPAFYTPVGASTEIEKGKEKRLINGKECLLEFGLRGDFALIRAHKADILGNLIYRGVMRTFNAVMATAANVVIAEVDEIVEPGAIDVENVVTPGIFVDRIVKLPEGKPKFIEVSEVDLTTYQRR